jgi:hypothetical protein
MTLVAIFIAALVALHDSQNLVTTLAGLALLVALFAYDERGNRNGSQSLVFAFVCGLALLCAVSYPVHAMFGDAGPAALPEFLAKNFSAVIWLLATVVFWFVDRSRIDARQASAFMGYSQPPAYVAPVVVPAPPPPVYQERSFVPAAAPVASAPPVFVPSPAPEVLAEPVPPPPPPAAAPIALTGKEVTIYVNIVGEGMSFLRAVQATPLGRDFYLIVDEMPADEKWEYTTGQVVRCRKKNLSSGKALVAYEEAPRA